MAYEFLASHLSQGYDAQLLQHAELVKDAPALGNLAIQNSVHGYAGDGGRIAGGGDAHQFASTEDFFEETAGDGFVGF